MQSFMLVNPVPGLSLNKPADQGFVRSAKRVSCVCVSNSANDLKDLLIISHLMEFLQVSSLH